MSIHKCHLKSLVVAGAHSPPLKVRQVPIFRHLGWEILDTISKQGEEKKKKVSLNNAVSRQHHFWRGGRGEGREREQKIHTDVYRPSIKQKIA